jgi:hypothetical protein
VSAPSLVIAYRSPVPHFMPTYSGFVKGQGVKSLKRRATCATKATSKSRPGNYAVTCKGAVAPGYRVKYVAGTLTIVKH